MLENYLKKTADLIRNSNKLNCEFFYRSIEEFVLLNGRKFKSQPLSKEEEELVTELIEKEYIDCKVRECYRNSQKLSLSNDKILYVEGFAKGKGLIPVGHSWNLINGKVIDLTWCNGNLLDKSERTRDARKKRIILGEFEGEYFGVIIPTRIIRKKIIKKGVWDSIIDNWENGFPLLKKKWRGENNGMQNSQRSNEKSSCR